MIVVILLPKDGVASLVTDNDLKLRRNLRKDDYVEGHGSEYKGLKLFVFQYLTSENAILTAEGGGL